MGLLEGDTALVTGAASGIGRGIARALAEEGVRLVLSDVAAAPGEEVARELGATFIASDLSQDGAAKALFEAAVADLGQISIFVHSASPRRQEDRTVLKVTEAEWDQMVNVGLRSGFLLGQAMGIHMKERGIRGRMLYLTSLHANAPRNLPHYSATKAGMTLVMKELARELGPHGIRVNALAPGPTESEALTAAGLPGTVVEQIKQDETARIPLGRRGTPDELAAWIVHLADPTATWITGQILTIDGGLELT